MTGERDSLLAIFGAAPIVFGLRAQGHIPTVERMLAEGASWDEIGKAIGWRGPTAQQFYEDYERDASAPSDCGRGGA